jgi:hypothetical protein
LQPEFAAVHKMHILTILLNYCLFSASKVVTL